MNEDVYPPVMNASMRTIFKVVGVYIAVQFVIFLCLAIVNAILIYGFVNNGQAFESTNPLLVGIAVATIFVLLLIPAVYAIARYYKYSNVLPNGEVRLTLAMLFASVACCFSLAIAAPKAGVLIDRLLSGNLPVYELLFALTSAAATYMINFIVALIGIRIGLRLTRTKFAP